MSLHSKLGWLLSKILYEWNPVKRRRKHRFYAQFIGTNDLCFDVGAHLGDRTDTWLRLGAKVVAFEPQPAFVQYLAQKFSHNALFSLEAIGLAEKPGKACLAISTLYPTLATLAGESWEQEIKDASNLSIDFDERVEVSVSTLDAMIETYGLAKFCKIDVEGYEHEVLKGLSQPFPFLSFEFLSFSEQRMKHCLKELQNLGYSKFNWSYKETFVLRFEHWVTADQVIEDIKHFKRGIFSGDIYVCHKEAGDLGVR